MGRLDKNGIELDDSEDLRSLDEDLDQHLTSRLYILGIMTDGSYEVKVRHLGEMNLLDSDGGSIGWAGEDRSVALLWS